MLTQKQKIHILSLAYKEWLTDKLDSDPEQIDLEWQFAIWREYEKSISATKAK